MNVVGGEAATKVFYISGNGRSGSTLLDRLLGQIPGMSSVGELRYIWRRSLHDNRLCGCGLPFMECPFWTDVGLEAFGGWRFIDVDRIIWLEQSVSKHRFLPAILAPGVVPGYAQRFDEYLEILRRLYLAIRVVSSSDIIIDSSKDPAYGFCLRRVKDVDMSLIHLVRDSRGVAFSWRKLVTNPDDTQNIRYLPQFRPSTIALRWIGYNLVVDLLGALVRRSITVRYEDFVRSPHAELGRILEVLGESRPKGALGFLSPTEVSLGVAHTVSGNPMRLRSGPIRIALDEEWRRAMPVSDRRVMTLTTAALLRRYGYSLS